MIAAVNGLAFAYRNAKDRYIIERVVVDNIYGVDESLAGKVAVDIGAHLGSFSVKAAHAGARVIAFEPEASNYSLLLTNIAGNRTRTSAPLDVAAVCAAVSDQAGFHRLYVGETENTGENSFFPEVNGLSGRVFQDVLAARLPDILDHYVVDEVELLKMDCEGAEREILPAVIRRPGRYARIGVEFHDKEFMASAVAQLRDYYHAQLVVDSEWEWRFIRK